ncbi:MAG: sulfite oxidase [Negativicutes bacterium]|nr:sulfite oxidase [Negativicutes bacterium]
MENKTAPARDGIRPGLTPVSAPLENLESPIQVMNSWVTPNELFYVRNHLPYPEITLNSWKLSVDGLVGESFTLGYEDLRVLPQVSRYVTFECAGNRRGGLPVPAPGPQWNNGAVGNAKWTGVPLLAVLDRAGILPAAAEIVFTGADTGSRADVSGQFSYIRSLPNDRGLLKECLLALAMNDEPLPLQHGFPLRLIVPGWYGMAHVKWLTGITATDVPFRGPWQAFDYVYVTDEDDYASAIPVTEMKVNSIITWPFTGQLVKQGSHTVTGVAWSGSGSIAGIQVSVDGGVTWQDARLTSQEHTAATWTFWRYPWAVEKPGRYTVMARAEDSGGNRQPLQSRWNAKGYGNNGIHTIQLTVPKPE